MTGATGFIGTHLLRKLLDQGHHCRCLVRRMDDLTSIFDDGNVNLFLGDITDANSLRDVGKDIDVAFHLAAEGHVASVSGKEYSRAFEINVRGTANFARACALNRVTRFIHFSSTAAMGLAKHSRIDETTPCHPVTPYQMSKYEAERILISVSRQLDLNIVILRPCMVYGPGGKGEFLKFCRLINLGIFPRIGTGANLTPMVYVEDVVQAAVSAIRKGKSGQVYLVASDRSYPLAEIHKSICDALNIRRWYPYVPVWAAYWAAFIIEHLSRLTKRPPIVSRMNIVSTAKDRVFDINKAMTELSYHPWTDLREGILETVTHYKSTGLI